MTFVVDVLLLMTFVADVLLLMTFLADVLLFGHSSRTKPIPKFI